MPEPSTPVAGTPDDDEQQASGITNELNKLMASNMAQAVAAGFGT